MEVLCCFHYSACDTCQTVVTNKAWDQSLESMCGCLVDEMRVHDERESLRVYEYKSLA
jgi:hypothetical protein